VDEHLPLTGLGSYHLTLDAAVSGQERCRKGKAGQHRWVLSEQLPSPSSSKAGRSKPCFSWKAECFLRLVGMQLRPHKLPRSMPGGSVYLSLEVEQPVCYGVYVPWFVVFLYVCMQSL